MHTILSVLDRNTVMHAIFSALDMNNVTTPVLYDQCLWYFRARWPPRVVLHGAFPHAIRAAPTSIICSCNTIMTLRSPATTFLISHSWQFQDSNPVVLVSAAASSSIIWYYEGFTGTFMGKDNCLSSIASLSVEYATNKPTQSYPASI